MKRLSVFNTRPIKLWIKLEPRIKAIKTCYVNRLSQKCLPFVVCYCKAVEFCDSLARRCPLWPVNEVWPLNVYRELKYSFDFQKVNKLAASAGPVNMPLMAWLPLMVNACNNVEVEFPRSPLSSIVRAKYSFHLQGCYDGS